MLVQALASIPSFLTGVIRFPKWAIKLINSQLAHLSGMIMKVIKKYHLAVWGSLTLKKEYGGFDITDIVDMNLNLLASWVSRYQRD